MQIDYTGQYAAKEIDRTVSLTSHSARKSFVELRTFNYFSHILRVCALQMHYQMVPNHVVTLISRQAGCT